MGEQQRGSGSRKGPESRDPRAEAVYRATLTIATELSLDTALQKMTDAARELVSARYGALGVVDEEHRRLTSFIVSGISREEIDAIHHWPRGLGLLGELIHFPRPLRVKEISEDPRSVGFPPNHPSMTSFLGVPIIRGERVLGNFYMTDKQGAEQFSEEDEEILSLFAAHAAIALENARLYTETNTRLKEKVVEVEKAERRARFLAELGEMLLRLAPGADLPLVAIAEKATEPLGDAATLILVDPGNPRVTAASALFHTAPARLEAAREVLSASEDRLKERVIRQGRPVLLADVSQAGEDSPFDAVALAGARFSSALAVPLATRQTVYGMFVSMASRPVQLTEEDMRFALLIADRIGGALDAGRLFRKELEARERVQELANLAQQRASELETILDTMAEAVSVVTPDMKLARVNASYARLVGMRDRRRSPGSMRRHAKDLGARDESGRQLPLEELPSARALRGEFFTNQVVVITPLGGNEDRFLSVSGAPIMNSSGEVVAAVNVARDVTEIKELDRLKDEFILVASHELKTPLTVVKGYAQLLERKLQKLPERAAEAGMAGHILDQADRMGALAERLLDVSRIQFGRLQLDKQEDVDLSALVKEALERLQVAAQNHPIRISAQPSIQATVDPGRIEQVITNLVSNAAKYSGDGTEIDVSLEHRNGSALLSVRDRGLGIPKEQQPYIFQRFYRARSGERKAGAGLGLYVSKGIVEAHGGRIWFDSEEGSGTTFYVELPAGT